jgi:hypothetical protein
LREREPGTQGVARRTAEQSHQQCNQRQLEGHQSHQQQRHQAEAGRHQRQVEHHADGDEEQAEQHVAKGLDLVLDLVAILGFRDQHAGEERAQGQRQAGQRGDEGHRQDHHQHVEHEQLGGLAPRHHAEPGAHHARPDKQQHRQHEGGLAQCHRHRVASTARGLTEHGYQDQQRHHREVLEQQHADDGASVDGVQLQPLGQQPHHHRGGGHRHDPAERQARLPVHRGIRAQHQRQPHARGNGERHLRRAKAEHLAPHLTQLGQAEFQPDGEHEKHHAEFGEVAGGVFVGDNVERARPEQDAHREVTDHRRQ